MLALGTAVAVVSGLTGCANTWEAVSSQRFRDKPWETTFGREDPARVLRTSPDGETRARAMRDLTETRIEQLSEAERTEVLDSLATAATADPSPWVRMAAIDALGRFKDPRTVEVLATAFHQATGRPAGAPQPIQPAAGRQTSLLGDRLGLTGPQGFPGDQVANVRGRALDALAKSGRPEAVEFLARVAAGDEVLVNEDPADRAFVRQHAVAGLGRMRQKEAVVALSKVLADEQGKDLTLEHLAHEGLVGLTGKNHPADPAAWNGVVQAGFEIAPEPNPIQKALGALVPE